MGAFVIFDKNTNYDGPHSVLFGIHNIAFCQNHFKLCNSQTEELHQPAERQPMVTATPGILCLESH